MTTKKLDPQDCRFTLAQARDLCTVLNDYFEKLDGYVTAVNRDSKDEATRTMIVQDVCWHLNVWQTLMQLLVAQIDDASDGLQVAIDDELHKGGA